MKLKVGMALKWRGETWMCTRLDRYEGIYKAYDKSEDWTGIGICNVIQAGPFEVEAFEAGDVVHRRECRAQLEAGPGKYIYIYTYLSIKLLVKGEHSGTAGSVESSASKVKQVEATWGQPGSWESSWLEGIGEACDAVDGARSVQQDVGDTGAFEEGVHATADDGGGGGNGSEDPMRRLWKGE